MEPLLAPIEGAHHQEIGGMRIDTMPAANGCIKRLIYLPGFRWSTDIRHLADTEFCMHTHIGFLAQGHVQGE